MTIYTTQDESKINEGKKYMTFDYFFIFNKI